MKSWQGNKQQKQIRAKRKLGIALAVFLLVFPLPSPVTTLEADAFDDLFYVPLEHLVHIRLQDNASCLPISEQREQSLLGQMLRFFQPLFCEKNSGTQEAS